MLRRLTGRRPEAPATPGKDLPRFSDADVHREPQQFRSPADHIIAQLSSDLAASRSEIGLLKAQLSAAGQRDGGGDSAVVAELQEQIERLQRRLAAAQATVEERAREARSAAEAAALQQDALAAAARQRQEAEAAAEQWQRRAGELLGEMDAARQCSEREAAAMREAHQQEMRRHQEGRGAELAQLRQQLEAAQRSEAAAAAAAGAAQQAAAQGRAQEEAEPTAAQLRQELSRAQRAQHEAEAALASERQQMLALEEAILHRLTTAAASAAEEEAEGWGSAAAPLAATQGSAALLASGAALAPPLPALSGVGAAAQVLRSAELSAPQQQAAVDTSAQTAQCEHAEVAAAAAECERQRCRAEQLERQVQEQQRLLDARQTELVEATAALSAARSAAGQQQQQHRRTASLPSDRSLLLQPGEGSDAAGAAAEVAVPGSKFAARSSSSSGSVNQPDPDAAAAEPGGTALVGRAETPPPPPPPTPKHQQEAARLQAELHQHAEAAAAGEAATAGLLAKLLARQAVQSALAQSVGPPSTSVDVAGPQGQLADSSGVPEAAPLPSRSGATAPYGGAQLLSSQPQQSYVQALEQQRLTEECAALRRQVLDMEAALAEAAAAAAGHGNPQQKIQYIQRVRQDLERLRRQCNALLRERHSLEQCIRYLAARAGLPGAVQTDATGAPRLPARHLQPEALAGFVAGGGGSGGGGSGEHVINDAHIAVGVGQEAAAGEPGDAEAAILSRMAAVVSGTAGHQ